MRLRGACVSLAVRAGNSLWKEKMADALGVITPEQPLLCHAAKVAPGYSGKLCTME